MTAHYDFVMVLASAVDALYQAGKDYKDGFLLAQYMRNTTYQGLQTGSVRIDAEGNSHLSYEVLGVATGATHFTVSTQ